MVAVKLLLVDGQSHQGNLPFFLQEIESVLSLQFSISLDVMSYARCIMLKVAREDGFSPVNHEERGVSCRPVWRCIQAPEDGIELVHPVASGVKILRFKPPSIKPLDRSTCPLNCG